MVCHGIFWSGQLKCGGGGERSVKSLNYRGEKRGLRQVKRLFGARKC